MKNESCDEKRIKSKKRTTKGSNASADEAAIDQKIEEKIDRDLRDSFPASDPPGWTMGIKKRRPKN